MAASVPTVHFNGLGGTLANQWTFVSTGRTGTGSLETINHGGGRRPLLVMVILDDTIGAANQYTIGVATNTSILVTVTNNATYSIVAYFGPGA